MNRKNGCVCLLLVLVCAWVDRLETGSFLVAPPTGTPSFGEEIYTLAMRDRDASRETVEAAPLAQLGQPPFSVPLVAREARCSMVAAAVPCLFSGARACFLFMSLQR